MKKHSFVIEYLNRPAQRGNRANDDVGDFCEVILDNWREFTGLQIGIAATLANYARPAEMMTQRQKHRLDQALEIAKDAGLVPA